MNFNNIKAISKKEITILKRDPRLIGLIAIMPILMLLLFGYALKLEPSNVKMAYVDQDKSYFSNLIKTSLWSDGYFKLYEVKDEQAIKDEIRAGHAKAGLFINSDFSDELTSNNQPHVKFYVDGTMPSLTTAMKSNSSAISDDSVTNDMYFLPEDSENIIIPDEPFKKDTIILFNPDEIETWFFLPGVIGVLIMQIALILTGTSIVREKEKHTLEQILVSPLSKIELVLGKIFPYIIISLADFYFILGIGWTIFDLPAPSSQLILFTLALIYVSVMISLGLFISIISQTQQQAMFMAIFIIIPSILLSGFIFPLEAIPEFIRWVSYIIPFTYFTESIRDILIKGTDFKDIYINFLILLGFTLVFIVASVKKFKSNIS